MNTYSQFLPNCSTEQEGHEQFLNSFYNLKQQTMSKHDQQFGYNQQIFKLFIKTRRRLDDLTKAMQIEDAKSYVDSYLIYPRTWYLSEVEKCHRKLARLIKLYKL